MEICQRRVTISSLIIVLRTMNTVPRTHIYRSFEFRITFSNLKRELNMVVKDLICKTEKLKKKTWKKALGKNISDSLPRRLHGSSSVCSFRMKYA